MNNTGSEPLRITSQLLSDCWTLLGTVVMTTFTDLLLRLPIGSRDAVGRFHWTLRTLKLRLQTHPLLKANIIIILSYCWHTSADHMEPSRCLPVTRSPSQ